MKVAYVFVPHFPLAVEVRGDPSLKGRIVVIGGLPHERGHVYEASLEALEQGVGIGMSLRQAEELCPEAVFLPTMEERYTSAFEELLMTLEAFSPFIEPHGLGGAYLEVSGLQHLYGPEKRLARSIAEAVRGATHLPVKVGIARGKFTARIATLEGTAEEDVQIIAPGKERRFLKELPVSLLPISEEMRGRLHLLGIRTMGQFASLPISAVLGQFGLEGRRAHQLARGRDESKVIARTTSGPQELEYRFEDPVGEMQVLQMTAKQLSTQLLARLHRCGQVCGRVSVTLQYDAVQEKRGLALSEPSSDEHKIGLVVERLISDFHYQDRVSALKLSLEQLSQGKGHQLSLFATRTLRQRRIDRAVANIVGKYGVSCFLQAQLLDLRAPLPERRFALLHPEAPFEHSLVKRSHEQAIPTSTKYRVHEWR